MFSKLLKSKLFISLALILAICVILYLLFRPSSSEKYEINHSMLVQQIEEMGQLEVVKYHINDIIEYNKMRDWLPNSKTVLIVNAEVIACINLKNISSNDVYINKDSVRLTLPNPEICHVKIDHSQSRIYDIQFGLWDTQKLIDEAYREAEKQIKIEAYKMNIEQDSRESAIKLMMPLLKMLGFKKIYINFETSNNSIDSNNKNIQIKNK